MTNRNQPIDRMCIQCYTIFTPENGHQRVCSDECRKQHQYQVTRDWRARSGRMNSDHANLTDHGATYRKLLAGAAANNKRIIEKYGVKSLKP